MTEEPENLILALLREIRGKLDEHDGQFNDVKLEVHDLRVQIEEWQETTATSVGFSTHATLRTQALEREIVELRHRIEKLEGTH